MHTLMRMLAENVLNRKMEAVPSSSLGIYLLQAHNGEEGGRRQGQLGLPGRHHRVSCCCSRWVQGAFAKLAAPVGALLGSGMPARACNSELAASHVLAASASPSHAPTLPCSALARSRSQKTSFHAGRFLL